MKICFCNTIASWGGGEKWHLEMALALSQKGHEVSFLLAEGGEIEKKLADSTIEKIPIKIGNLSFLNPFKLLKLATLFRKKQFNALLINNPTELKLIALAGKIAGIKKIIYRRGSDVVVKNYFLNRYILEQAVSDIIANSKATKDSLLKTGIKIRNKIALINNGVSPPLESLPAVKNKIPVIGAVGRLSHQKGFDFLVEIVNRLKQHDADFKVRVAGEGKERDNIEQLVAKYGLRNHIELVGFVSDVYGFLNQCDIFALPSRYEGFGYVTVEAMFMKKPVVAFDISSTREIVDNRHTAFLVEPYDINGFAEKLKKLLFEPELRRQMGSKGYERAMERYRFQMTVQKIEKMIKTLH